MKLTTILIAAATTLATSSAFADNLQVNCYQGIRFSSSATPLVSFEVADSKSNRLVSDLTESRSSSDSETLPAYLVSQYKFQPLELLVELDDGTADGNLSATLQGVYAGRKSGERARYLGAYKRYDAGRQLSSIVTCVVK